jgi:hypothetical protein
MLNVANGPILAEKNLKKPFLGKIPKRWKNSTKKNVFFFQPNQVGFSRL